MEEGVEMKDVSLEEEEEITPSTNSSNELFAANRLRSKLLHQLMTLYSYTLYSIQVYQTLKIRIFWTNSIQ